MFRYFRSKTNTRAAKVCEVFRKYSESYIQFLDVAERRAALKLSPDKNLNWQNGFRLQRLLQTQLASRFEYLFERGRFDKETWKSLDDIFERLNSGWSEAEEADLRANVASYAEISRQIEDIRSIWNPNLIDDPGGVLQQDEEFRNAQMSLAENSKKLRIQLSH